MSYPGHLAKKYIVNQKRHSVFTVLSITAAVLFITVIFTLFSSFWDTMLNVNRMADPWHAIIEVSDEESLEIIKNDEYIIEHEIVEGTVSGVHTVLGIRVKFRSDIWEPTEHIQTILNDTTVYPVINQELLNYEVIGVKARGNLVFVISVVYCFVLIVILCSRMIIDTAFEISSKERESQFGILASVGASKKQVVHIIMWEGIYLSAIGIPIGILAGIGVGRIIFELVLDSEVLFNYLGSRAEGAVFTISPLYIFIVAVTGLLWVMLSAYGTGMRFAKKPPVEVIRHSGEKIIKVKKSRILGKLFGISGKLASRNIRRNKKRFIVTVVTITLSFVITVFTATLINMCNVMYDSVYNNPIIYDKLWDYSYNYGDYYEDPPTPVDLYEGEKILRDSGVFGIVSADLSIANGATLKDLPLTDEFKKTFTKEEIDSSRYLMIMQFVNEEYYNYMFSNNPPVPYKELLENDGFVMTELKNEYNKYSKCPFIMGSEIKSTYTEYNDDGSPAKETPINGKIMGYSQQYWGNSGSNTGLFIGTEEHYVKMFGSKAKTFYYNTVLDLSSGMSLSQADKLVQEFNDKLEKDEENIVMYMFNTSVDQLIASQRFMDALMIFGVALIVLIAFIALVNVVNIISTGILNRRRENASLKSIGMSSKQLNGMLILECALYVIIASVITLAVTEGFVLLTNLAINGSAVDEEQAIDAMSYFVPLITVLAGSVPVFLVGVITTFITQSGVKDNAISEELKNMD